MKTQWMVVTGWLQLCCAAWAFEYITPEELAFWVEPAKEKNAIVVCASWARDGIQGWSFGLCHDPAAAYIEDCTPRDSFNPYRDPLPCGSVICPDELGVSFFGHEPTYIAVSIHEGGITQAVVGDFCQACTFDRTDRLEVLKIRYTLTGDRTELTFCEDLGVPRTETVIVHGGLNVQPATQRGMTLPPGHPFVRGDTNGDGRHDIADAIALYTALFTPSTRIPCLDAADANHDAAIDLADVITILSYLFLETGPLAAPFPDCGSGPEETALGCWMYPPCAAP